MSERNPLDNLGSLCLAGYGYVKFCRHHGIDPRKFIDCIEDVCFQDREPAAAKRKENHDHATFNELRSLR